MSVLSLRGNPWREVHKSERLRVVVTDIKTVRIMGHGGSIEIEEEVAAELAVALLELAAEWIARMLGA